jgi:hypothetical protein
MAKPTPASVAWPFTLARVAGGWQVYDAERHEHLGRVWHRRLYAEQAFDTLRGHRPPIVRFILTGTTGLETVSANG